MVLFLHNRYRRTGGEERVVEDLARLVRERLGEPVRLLRRDSTGLARGAAARGLLYGGFDPDEVEGAVRSAGARVVHAHNLQPTLGWRALAAARAEGARVVLHLHQYRLVCAVGVCFTGGEECTRCHGRNTLPGVLRNCRGSRAQALAYGAGLALWQRRTVEQADAVIVPSVFARERLRALGAPLPWERVHVLAPPVWASDGGEADSSGADSSEVHSSEAHSSEADSSEADSSEPRPSRPYALVVSRLSPEKGIDVAIDACRIAGVALVVAGEGPERERLRARVEGGVHVDGAVRGDGAVRADGAMHVDGAVRGDGAVRADRAARVGGAPRAGEAEVSFVGHVDEARLARLRARAAVALVPSRSAETFGLAAAEAMAAGLPVAASRVGALPELVEEEGLVEPGDADELAATIERLRGDPGAGERARVRVRAICAPEVVAARLAAVYDGA